MRELVTGLVLIAVFFVLFFMLKSGYEKNKETEEEEGNRNNDK